MTPETEKFVNMLYSKVVISLVIWVVVIIGIPLGLLYIALHFIVKYW